MIQLKKFIMLLIMLRKKKHSNQAAIFQTNKEMKKNVRESTVVVIMEWRKNFFIFSYC